MRQWPESGSGEPPGEQLSRRRSAMLAMVGRGRAAVSMIGGMSSYTHQTTIGGGGLSMFNGWILGIIAVAAVVFVIVWIINIRKDKAKP